MKRLSAKQQATILFIVLSVGGAIVQYFFYLNDIAVVKDQTRYVFNLENQRIKDYLHAYSEVLDIYKMKIERSKRFDKKKFEKAAQEFIFHFKDTKAFNFVNSDRVIININPKLGNEAALGKDLKDHPDSLIREKLSQGLSRHSVTFIPPVNIYQGGSAIIFYVPLNFSDEEFGWINVVILSENLFKNYRKGLGFFDFDFDFSVIDQETGRSFFGDIFEREDEQSVLHFSSELLGRQIDYIFDLHKQFNFQRNQGVKKFSFHLIMVSILSLFFFLYSRNRRELYKQLVNVSNESNLLKTLIHDITNPIQAVLLGLQGMQMEKRYNEKTMDLVLQKHNITAEIINSVRSIFSGKYLREEEVEINLKDIVDKLLSTLEPELEKSQVSVDVHILGNPIIRSKVDEKLLKNQIIRNIISNSIKFSPRYSNIDIDIYSDRIVVKNHHELLSDQQIQLLNSMKPLPSTEDNNQKSSLGLGMFITKIFCLHANLEFKLTQNRQTEMIEAMIRFKGK